MVIEIKKSKSVYFNEYEEELKFLKSIGFKSLGEHRYYLKDI